MNTPLPVPQETINQLVEQGRRLIADNAQVYKSSQVQMEKLDAYCSDIIARGKAGFGVYQVNHG